MRVGRQRKRRMEEGTRRKHTEGRIGRIGPRRTRRGRAQRMGRRDDESAATVMTAPGTTCRASGHGEGKYGEEQYGRESGSTATLP